VGIACGISEIVNDVYNNEKTELDTEAKQIADYVRNRHHKAREINLSEDIGVLYECSGCFGNTVCKILPKTSTCKVKQWPGNSIGRNTGYAAENNHIHYHRQGGLYYIPDRAKDGLFVLGYDVALDE
jgi:hypothetical protein